MTIGLCEMVSRAEMATPAAWLGLDFTRYRVDLDVA